MSFRRGKGERVKGKEGAGVLVLLAINNIAIHRERIFTSELEVVGIETEVVGGYTKRLGLSLLNHSWNCC